MSLQFVVSDMDDVTRPVIEVLKRAKELVGYEDEMTVVSIEDADFSEVTVGLGNIKGTTYRTLSPKQLLTKGTSLTFLTQVMRNALDHENLKYKDLVEGEDYSVVRTEEDVRGLKSILAKEPEVSIDIETGGDADHEPWGIQWLLSISMTVSDYSYVIAEEVCETEATKELMDWLCNKSSCTTIGHNSTYDAGLISKRLGIKVYFDDDTMIQHYTMFNTAQEHGLKPLAQRIFGAPDWDSANKKYLKGGAHYENIPREQLYKYNCFDTVWTYRLYKLFHEWLEDDPSLRAYYEYKMTVCHMLQDVQAYGVLVDPQMLRDIGKQCEDRATSTLAWLRSAVGNDLFNPGSTKQLKEAIHSLYGATMVSTDEDHLEELADTVPESREFVDTLLSYRRSGKLKSTYVDGTLKLIGSDGRVHPTYLPHGTKTGRLSCKRPNFQNSPRGADIKSSYIAGPGNKIVACDYSQLEARVSAELCGDEHMIAAFQPDAGDFFDNLISRIYSDRFVDLKGYQKFKEDNHDEAKNIRASIKSVCYGLAYGRGVSAIAKQLKIAIEEAQDVVDRYLAAYPKLKEWQDSVREAVGRDDLAYRVESCYGLRFKQEVVTYRTRNKIQNEMLAFRPQSEGGDTCLIAAVEVNKRIGRYGAHIVGLIHDAIYVECPEEHTDTVGYIMKREMEGAARRRYKRVPFVADPEVGDNCAEV